MLVYGALDEGDKARWWLRRVARREVEALVPDLVWSEVANAFLSYVRADEVVRADAAAALAYLRGLPLVDRPVGAVISLVLGAAFEHDLSAYDAAYVVVAAASDATLVTADRRLAAAAARSELVD